MLLTGFQHWEVVVNALIEVNELLNLVFLIQILKTLSQIDWAELS